MRLPANFPLGSDFWASSVVPPAQDASRPNLFGQLDLDIFGVSSGANRALYERAILAVYDELYRSDLLFPTQAEIVRVIYKQLSREPATWMEDRHRRAAEAERPIDPKRVARHSRVPLFTAPCRAIVD